MQLVLDVHGGVSSTPCAHLLLRQAPQHPETIDVMPFNDLEKRQETQREKKPPLLPPPSGRLNADFAGQILHEIREQEQTATHR